MGVAEKRAFLTINRRREKSMKYIVDIHHGIGDLIHMLPTLKALSESEKGTVVDVIVASKFISDFLDSQNIVSNAFVLGKMEFLKQKIFHPLKNYDYGIVAPCIVDKKKSSYLLRILGARRIISESDEIKRNFPHRVDRGIEMIKQLHIVSTDRAPHIFVPQNDMNTAKKYLSHLDICKKTIVLCTGGNHEKVVDGGKVSYINIKHWPVKFYHDLCEDLINKFNLVLIGCKQDGEIFWKDFSHNLSKNQMIDLTGKTKLMETAGILKLCDLAVGNDTGMIHMAAAVGTATMTIFCSTNPREIGAYADNAIYIEEYLPCKYCYVSEKTYTCKERICITQIKPERVLKEIEGYFSNGAKRGVMNKKDKYEISHMDQCLVQHKLSF